MTENSFTDSIKAQNLFLKEDPLLLAVSGGVDSVVLCELCFRAGFNFEMAHANFQLRGEESEADEKFVRQLALKYGVKLHCKKFSTETYSKEKKIAIQEAARDLRYAWFRELLQNGKKYLLTAHHADDNIETVLMNFFRGTGIAGLTGIPAKQDTIIRPLLQFSKPELLNFAVENNLEWREDSSNGSDKYSRNYVRHNIIPLVTKLFPSAEKNITANIERLTQAEQLYRQAIDSHKKKLLEINVNEIHIPILKLKKTFPVATVLYEIISPYGFSSGQLEDVMHLLDASQGKFVASATHRVFRNRDWLIISPVASLESGHVFIEEGVEQMVFAEGKLKIKTSKNKGIELSSARDVAQLNSSKLEYPLILRRWKQGDYFYPLGLGKKKKISRFLIDHKLSVTQKEKVWVIESGKKICWVVGQRIDDRFKVTGDHTITEFVYCK